MLLALNKKSSRPSLRVGKKTGPYKSESRALAGPATKLAAKRAPKTKTMKKRMKPSSRIDVGTRMRRISNDIDADIRRLIVEIFLDVIRDRDIVVQTTALDAILEAAKNFGRIQIEDLIVLLYRWCSD